MSKCLYLATTFSPMMLGEGVSAVVTEINLDTAKRRLGRGFYSAVGHEITAEILSLLLGREVEFNRIPVILNDGDELICIVPNFRANQAREFTREEVEGAGVRAFYIMAVQVMAVL